jgi:hypothetical protein
MSKCKTSEIPRNEAYETSGSRFEVRGKNEIIQKVYSLLPSAFHPFGPERLDLSSSTGLTAEGLLPLTFCVCRSDEE